MHPASGDFQSPLILPALAGSCLVDAGTSDRNDHAPVELILASGDRVRLAPGTDAATLRTVLNVLRERA